jgi:phage portal protein BeeE
MEWTTDTVLAHHAVYACITRIAQDIGKLRPKLVERDTNGIWTETENAAHSPALRRPNRHQNHIQFKESWAISKLTRGNTYVLIERDSAACRVRSTCSTHRACRCSSPQMARCSMSSG